MAAVFNSALCDLRCYNGFLSRLISGLMCFWGFFSLLWVFCCLHASLAAVGIHRVPLWLQDHLCDQQSVLILQY